MVACPLSRLQTGDRQRQHAVLHGGDERRSTLSVELAANRARVMHSARSRKEVLAMNSTQSLTSFFRQAHRHT